MFLIRRVLLSKNNSTFKFIQKQITFSKNVDAISLNCGGHFCQQRFCFSEFGQQPVAETEKHPVGQVIAKMKLIFTCKKCSTRNNKIISKLGYEKGVVIVRCDGCNNNHLIADNLGWFCQENQPINIEHILRKKGEIVQRIPNDSVGYIEFVTKEVLLQIETERKLSECLSGEKNEDKRKNQDINNSIEQNTDLKIQEKLKEENLNAVKDDHRKDKTF